MKILQIIDLIVTKYIIKSRENYFVEFFTLFNCCGIIFISQQI